MSKCRFATAGYHTWRRVGYTFSSVHIRPYMLAQLTRPIRKLPYYAAAAQPAGTYPVVVVPLEQWHVDYWHAVVQPQIDAHYQWAPTPVTKGLRARSRSRAKTFQTKPIRADVKWNWRRIMIYAKLFGFSAPPTPSPLGIAYGWCLALDFQNGALPHVPIGLLTLVPEFECTVQHQNRPRGFVWYLSDAPAEHYAQLQVDRVIGVAATLLDMSIQTRTDLGLDRCTILHADPHGGDGLLNFYTGKCNMIQLPRGQGISPMRPRWRNDGRYFSMDNATALAFCARFDSNR